MLTRGVTAVVEVPQLGTLTLRVPLAEGVAQREDPLLGARALLVAATAAEDRVEAVLGDGIEQRDGLQRVADAVGALGEPAVGEVILDLGDVQAQVVTVDDVVAEL